MNAEPKNFSALAEVEPTSAPTTVPMWLMAAMLILLFLGAWYFDARGGWFEAKVYTPYTSIPENFLPPPLDGPDLRLGKILFEKNCALCHNSDGAGKPGQAPPLAGSEWVLAKGVNRLIRIPRAGLNGPVEVNGQAWNLSMAAMGNKGTYSAEDLALVLSYVRTAWGNNASFVTPEQVQAVDTDLGNRSQLYTVDELKKLSE